MSSLLFHCSAVVIRFMTSYLCIIYQTSLDFVGSLRCWIDYCLNWRLLTIGYANIVNECNLICFTFQAFWTSNIGFFLACWFIPQSMGLYCFEEYKVDSWIFASECSYLAGSSFFNNDKTSWCYGRLSLLEAVQVLTLRWSYIRWGSWSFNRQVQPTWFSILHISS